MRYLLCFLIALPLVVPGQAPQAPEPTLRSTTSEVLLDLVVRDKHGKILHNLRPDEVQVFENGVPQTVRHFEFVNGHAATPASPALTPAPPTDASAPDGRAPAAPPSVNELRDISVVSVVIANLDPRGRKLTLDAMRRFVQADMQPNTYVGVFSLDLAGLRYIQTYTNNAEKISAGVARAVGAALNTQLAAVGQLNTPETSHGAADTATGPASDPTSGPSTDPNGTLFGPAAGPTGGATASASGPAAEINQMMESNWVSEMQDVYVDSQRYLTPLRALVQSQADIPGRKVVLLFSAGLPVHDDTVELLRSVISTANRANVSIYALDTRGTTTQSTLDYSRNLLQRAARKSREQQSSPDKTVTPGEVILGEMAETSIHSDTRSNLAELAEGTGGQLLPDTLDLLEPLQRALEDVRTHYELTYSPSNSTTDGSFRKIEVKVSRPGARVFARSGYYALPVLNGQQIYPFEMATLKALNTRPELHQFDFRAAALEFRPGPVRTQMAFAFEAPIRDLRVTKDGQWERIHVDVTALIKNDQGQVVDKISKDIAYREPENMLANMEQGVVSFTSPFLLPPGHYTIETAAIDRESMRASVSRSTIDSSETAGLAMSDITIARRVDPIQGPAVLSDPLVARGGKITPELSNSIQQPTGGQMEFYAVAYPAAPVDAPVQMNIELWRDGKAIMRSTPSPIPTDPTGAASVLVSVPTQKLPSGSYQAHVAFQYKGQTVTKSVAFTLGTGS
ncbi:MAG TPA: VWA domain-containing protein [Terracidiphilus sp.]|jgi:VWFA-related protein|nr:VWA domain-containing protein [Terracidiphilus sp.]